MADSEAIIGQGTFIRGNLRGDGDLNVAGRIEGSIEIRGEVVFEETSMIQSDVSADRIVVRGALSGNLRAADAIVLDVGSRVVGDLDAPRIQIEEGALFRGRIDMGGEVSKATPKAVQQARPAPRTAQRVAPAPKPALRTTRTTRSVETSADEAQPEAAPTPSVPKPSKVRVNPEPAAEAKADQPPPPVVPALKKKSKGAVRKRGAE